MSKMVKVQIELPVPVEGYQWRQADVGDIELDDSGRGRFMNVRLAEVPIAPAPLRTVSVTMTQEDGAYLYGFLSGMKKTGKALIDDCDFRLSEAFRVALGIPSFPGEICGEWRCGGRYGGEGRCENQGKPGDSPHDLACDPRWQCTRPRGHTDRHEPKPVENMTQA